MMEEDDDIDSLSLDDDEEDDQRTNNNNNNNNKKKKSRSKNKNKNNKRRFSDEQVKSLETIFESETKLEPRKKVEVARELGLQPRQVAIWFQNKRARWKSKQIEKNYRILKSNYDNLKARLEVVRRDKESLITQVQELRRLVDKSHHDEKTERNELMTGNNDSRDNREKDDEELVILQDGHMVYSDEDNNKSGNNNNMSSVYLGESEQLILNNMTENIDNNGPLSSIISPVNKWCSFDAAGNLFDQASSNSHWWESWT